MASPPSCNSHTEGVGSQLAPISSIIGDNSKVAIELSVRIFLSRHDHLADRPERYSSKFQMCPSERDAHYGDSEDDCGDEMP